MVIERVDTQDCRNVHFRITDWCNFKCSYCIQGLERQPDHLETTEYYVKEAEKLRRVLDAIDELFPVAKEQIELIGGEISGLDLKEITKPLIGKRPERINYFHLVTNMTWYKNLLDYANWLDEQGIKLRILASLHEEFMKPEVYFERLFYLKEHLPPKASINCTFVVHDDNIEIAELFQNTVKDAFPCYAINAKRERQRDIRNNKEVPPYVTEKTLNWIDEHYHNVKYGNEFKVDGINLTNRTELTNPCKGLLDTIGMKCTNRNRVVRYDPIKGLRFGCGVTDDDFKDIICPRKCSLCSAVKIVSNNKEE